MDLFWADVRRLVPLVLVHGGVTANTAIAVCIGEPAGHLKLSRGLGAAPFDSAAVRAR